VANANRGNVNSSQIPFIGPLRAAQLVALMQTPHRFRSKLQLWTYSGLAVETHDSAQYRYVNGQLQRSKKPQQVRGLNQNHNHVMKEIFKSAALSATGSAGPFQDFYTGLLARNRSRVKNYLVTTKVMLLPSYST
jgi:hypothetical protein